jgi:hypothetical protein
LKTTQKALADLRFGQFLEDRHKELPGELNVEPVPLRVLVKELLESMEANRSEKYKKLARQFTEKWLPFFGAETLTTAITARMIQRYAIARKKDKSTINGTQIANATVNRDLASLKHMLYKAEIWATLKFLQSRRVENLGDDGAVRTDYYTAEQLKLLVSTASDTRGAHPLNFNDWPEFIVLDANTGLRCKEMLFLEFSDIDWNAGVLHVRNKNAIGLPAEGTKRAAHPAQCASDVRASIDASEEACGEQLRFSPGEWLAVEVDPGVFPIASETVWVQTIGRSHPEAYFWGASRAEGCGHGGDPGFARTSQRDADGKVLRASGAEQSRVSGAASQQKGKFITQIITQNGFCTIFGQ